MDGLVNLFGLLGQRLAHSMVHLARFSRFVSTCLYWLFVAPFHGRRIRWGSAFIQMVRMGVDSLPIVGTISFFVGLIIAMQSAHQLAQFGASIYVADLVGVSITRELGPLITAILVAGRCGSAVTAEIGSMKVAEELDALSTMALNPVGFLVVPRMLAMMIMLPCLTVIADLLGILGGVVLAVTTLDIPFIAYYNETASALVLADFLTGLFKSFIFALIIILIGAYQGFNVQGGAEGVGRSTTASVVISIFLIILADLLFTALFYSTF
jgi:phospholipid/cholesterol/gamma-HCH transport system permease protein